MSKVVLENGINLDMGLMINKNTIKIQIQFGENS